MVRPAHAPPPAAPGPRRAAPPPRATLLGIITHQHAVKTDCDCEDTGDRGLDSRQTRGGHIDRSPLEITIL